MATTISLDPQNVLQMTSNFNQSSLSAIYNGEPTIENFTYRNAGEDNDLAHAYVRIRITDVDTSVAPLEYAPQEFVLRADDRVFTEWADYLDDIEEIVLFLSTPSANTEISVEDTAIYGGEGFFISGYAGINFSVMAKTSDGTILESYNWGYVPLNNCTFSTYTDANGNYHFGWAREFEDGHAIFWWPIGNNNGGFMVDTPALNYMQHTNFITSHDVYKDYKSAYNHLKFGTDDGKLEEDGSEGGTSERDTDVLYFNCKIMRTQFSHRNPSEFVENVEVKFKIKSYDSETGKMIPNANRGVIGWVDDSVSGYKNVRFIYNTTTKNVLECSLNGTDIKPANFDYSQFYGTYTDNFKYGNYYYYGRVNTNMYIFDSLHNAQLFLDGLNDGLNGLITGGQVGDLTDMTLTNNDVNYNVGMSETYILTQTQVSQLADRFNMNVTADGNILDGLFMGLSMYNNPIDVCIDLFALPVSVTDFVETSSHSIDFNPKKRATN